MSPESPVLSLDDVFCTCDLRSCRARCLERSASDHRPLVVEFQLAAENRR